MFRPMASFSCDSSLPNNRHNLIFRPHRGCYALTNSIIDKSGKKFAPKAPARRPAAPVSSQTSARPSVDRQVHSQTPQPQSVAQLIAVSPTPSVSLPTPASTQQPVTTAQAPPSGQDAATRIPELSQGPTPPRHPSSGPAVSQKQSSAPRQSPHQPTPVNQTIEKFQTPAESRSVTTQSGPEPSLSNVNSTSSQLPATQNEGPISTTVIRSSTGAPKRSIDPSSTQAIPDDTGAPIAKRRRTAKKSAANISNSSADANIALPTTETSELVPDASNSQEAFNVSHQPPKAKKPRLSAQARRKQQIEDAAAAIVEAATGNTSTTTKKPRQPAKRKGVDRDETNISETRTDAAPESAGATERNQTSAKPKRKYTKRKSRQSLQGAAAEIVEEAVNGSSKDAAKRGRRRKRVATPDGADTMVISTSEVRMADLCKDGRTGRKSEREKELIEYERAEFVRKKQRQLQEIMGQAEPEGQGTLTESADARLERLERERQEESVAQNVPNTIIVDGQIRIDEDSLQIDRHAAAAIERAAEQLEAVDESDLTRKVNSGSWMKRDRSGGWNALLTERFYDGLRMFGTDFEMISKMFPGRTRHKIKLKFVKEEKVNYERIRATLLGQPIPVDLPEFEKMAGTEFDDPQELERDMEEDRKRLEEETAAEKQALEDTIREREEAIAAERATAIADEESSSKENRGRKGKKKQKGEKRKTGEPRRKDKHMKRSSTAARNSASRELGEAIGADN